MALYIPIIREVIAELLEINTLMMNAGGNPPAPAPAPGNVNLAGNPMDIQNLLNPKPANNPGANQVQPVNNPGGQLANPPAGGGGNLRAGRVNGPIQVDDPSN